MAMNKFMHPRNPYKKRPDFKQLATDYPQFRKFAKQELSGKIQFNFKDKGAVLALTKTLLQRDFSLTVNVLPGKLVPTLPLRLNYLLWVEDLLNLCQLFTVRGIDIGTGSSCVYPLIAARKFQWHMLATEIDPESVKCAIANVEKNSLQLKIKVKQVSEDVILEGVLEEGETYDFCMCNPPFFADVEELSMETKSRCPASREPPHNEPTGSPAELVTPGGETAFIGRIIEESARLNVRVRIYTVMVGKKANLGPLKNEIKKKNVTSMSTTMFCQGKTTRWGLAWTYLPGLDLSKIGLNTTKKVHGTVVPYTYTLTVSEEISFNSVKEKLLILLEKLKIEITTEIVDEAFIIHIKAKENTWINSRRKRRQEKVKNMDLTNDNRPEDKSASNESRTEESAGKPEISEGRLNDVNRQNVSDNGQNDSDNEQKECGSCDLSKKRSLDDSSECSKNKKSKVDNTCENDTFRIRVASRQTLFGDDSEARGFQEFDATEYALIATIILRNCGEELIFELIFTDGKGGKESANQLLQYIKNKIK